MLLYYVFSLVVILNLGLVVSFDNVKRRRITRQNVLDPCITSSNQTGVCIRITYCPPMLTLQQKLQHCEGDANGDGYEPLVCCATSIDALSAEAKLPITTERVADEKSGDFSRCGVANRKPVKIVGGIANGADAVLADWPWIAALYYRTRSDPNPKAKCGGSLISKDWVVTAAHCVDSRVLLTSVRFGDSNLNDSIVDGATPIDVPVRQVIMHPEFASNPVINDIALIHLRNSITFSKHVRTICIVNGRDERFKSDEYYQRKKPYVAGYGRHQNFGELATALQEAQLDHVDIVKCAKNYNGYNAVIDNRVLCAGGGGKDSCQGSSGGPLILPIEKTWYLIGIVSFGVGCGDPDYPGVYTKVAEYSDWIANVTGLQI